MGSRRSCAARIGAAVIGGYGFAVANATACALLLPMPRIDAVHIGLGLGFAFYAGAVLWAFAARTAGRAWLGLLVPTGIAGAASLLVVWAGGPGWPI